MKRYRNSDLCPDLTYYYLLLRNSCADMNFGIIEYMYKKCFMTHETLTNKPYINLQLYQCFKVAFRAALGSSPATDDFKNYTGDV